MSCKYIIFKERVDFLENELIIENVLKSVLLAFFFLLVFFSYQFYCLENINVSRVSFIVMHVPEFAESLQEMGSCLLEKTALNDDEESGEWVNLSRLPHPS